jgi:type I restriction enzyme S subunit
MINQPIKEQNTLYAPRFVESWEGQPLYPLAEWINGMAFRDFNFTPKGRPVVKIAEIKNGISKQTKFTDQQYNDVYLLKKGDMLFCWSGQPQTSIDVFWWNGPEGWLNQHIFKVIPKIENKLFFFYLLKYLKPNFVQIAINKQTTGLGHVTKGDLARFIVKLPTDKEQCAIASVLSSLDGKIELLRHQNKTLEFTAQTIFKEWFVKFNLPGTTGKMVDSELGEIPEGWRVGHLTEVFDFMEGPGIRNWQYTASGRRFINIRLIQDGDININASNFISEEEAETTYKHFHLQEKDMVVSTSGTLGRCAIVRKEHLPLMLNTSVIRFRPIDRISYGFMYQYLNSNIFKNELESLASGSVQLNFGPVHLKQIEMLIPSKDVLQKFAEAVNPLYQKICFNLSQVQTLATLRDTLLPKMMKGEVRVKGFDC